MDGRPCPSADMIASEESLAADKRRYQRRAYAPPQRPSVGDCGDAHYLDRFDLAAEIHVLARHSTEERSGKRG